jgi:hypothetical protein
MTSSRKLPSHDEARRFWAEIAEHLASLPSQEAVADLRASGKDIAAYAREARAVLDAAVLKHRQERLAAGRQARESWLTKLRDGRRWLPGTAEERRTLLARVLAHSPALSTLTAQARDLWSMPDDDVTGILEQFAVLGVLDDVPKDVGE